MENELEQANIEEEVETEELEYTDSEEETEAEPVEEPTEEPEKVKTFTQDEVDELISKRIKRERNRIERDYSEELNKYKELAYLTEKGLKANDLDETLEKSRQFYGEQGIKYVPNANTKDEEILAKAYSNEIIEEYETLDELTKYVNKLSNKNNLTNKEKLVLENLNSEITNRKRLTDLRKIGVSEDIYNSKEFREFESKFTKETPIDEIYNLYNSSKKQSVKPANPGSMKSTPGKENKTFFTSDEVDKMNGDELEKYRDLILESMSKW